MNTAPNEIIRIIYTFLPKADVKSLRETCKTFSGIGEELLFADFEFRLYPRVSRLLDLACLVRSPISRRLKCLSYESGILPEEQDYRLWEAAEYSRREAEFAKKYASRPVRRDRYHVLRAELNERFSPSLADKYDQYRWWLDHQAEIMSEAPVIPYIANSLRLVPWVQELKLVMREPTIRLEDLEQGEEAYREHASRRAKAESQGEVSRFVEVANRRKYVTNHFHSLFQAMVQLCNEGQSLSLTRFSTINLPYEILMFEGLLPAQSSTDRIQVSESFIPLVSSLTHFSLSISHFPHSDYLSRGGPSLYTRGRDLSSLRLMALLNLSPTSLTHLSLSFPSLRKSEFSFALFDTTNLDRFPRLFLPNLTHFHLSDFTCTYGDFAAFFSAASAPSLTHLSLHDGSLETGSLVWMIRLLATTKRPHRLTSFSPSGEWRVFEDDGKWHSFDGDDYTSCLDYEGAYPKRGLRHRIQEYVVGGEEENCPLPVWGRDESARSLWDDAGDASFHYHSTEGATWWSEQGRQSYNAYSGVVPEDVP